ncbi:MAG: hypothetical protein ACRDOY_08595 [Nocardioidaceae bacterium]
MNPPRAGALFFVVNRARHGLTAPVLSLGWSPYWHCDPNMPPIPPHATFEQMKSTPMRWSRAIRTLRG